MCQEKKNGPNETADQSSRKNTIKQQRNSQPIRCTVQNTGNQDAHRNGWVWLQNRGKSEGYEKSEIKKNTQGTNSKGKETRTQINGLDQKEEINIQPEQNEKTRIEKNNEERLGTSGAILNAPTFKL